MYCYSLAWCYYSRSMKTRERFIDVVRKGNELIKASRRVTKHFSPSLYQLRKCMMSNHSIDSIKTPHMSLYSVLTSGRLPKDTEMKIQWVKHSLIKRTIVRELNLLVSYRDQLNLHSGNYTFIFVQLIYFINRFIWLMSNIDVSFTLDIEVGHYFKPDQDLFKIWCSKVI